METVKMIAEINTADVEFFKKLLNKFRAKKVQFQEQNIPNKITLEAMKEAENMRKNKNRKVFSDVEELLTFLKE